MGPQFNKYILNTFYKLGILVDTWGYKDACSPRTHNQMEEKNWKKKKKTPHEAVPREEKEVAHLETCGKDSTEVCILGRAEILQVKFIVGRGGEG